MEFGGIYHVPCPSDDVAVMEASRNVAMAMFGHHCPEGALVTNVLGVRETGQMKCAWIVTYDGRDNFGHVPRDELARQIMNAHPNNTRIVKHYKQYPPGLILMYSINCACPVSPSPGTFTNQNGSFIKEFDSDSDSDSD